MHYLDLPDVDGSVASAVTTSDANAAGSNSGARKAANVGWACMTSSRAFPGGFVAPLHVSFMPCGNGMLPANFQKEIDSGYDM